MGLVGDPKGRTESKSLLLLDLRSGIYRLEHAPVKVEGVAFQKSVSDSESLALVK